MKLELENNLLTLINNNIIICVWENLWVRFKEKQDTPIVTKSVPTRFLFITKRKIMLRVELAIRHHVNEMMEVQM